MKQSIMKMAIAALLVQTTASHPILAQTSTDAQGHPVTLPSYPVRPVGRPEARPPVRPPIRPPVRPPIGQRPDVDWGYHYPSGGGYASTVRCESFSGRFRSCTVRTQGRVVLERRHNGRCRYGNGWGYDRSRIWVNHNCRATFAYGVGRYQPRYRSDRDDTALIVGGVVVAAGLVAILSSNASKSGKKADSFPAQSTATIEADLGGIAPAIRPALNLCLEKASQNVAATGGSKLRLDDVTLDEIAEGLYRFDVDVSASYPDRIRKLPFSCTASTAEVEDFDFVTE